MSTWRPCACLDCCRRNRRDLEPGTDPLVVALLFLVAAIVVGALWFVTGAPA